MIDFILANSMIIAPLIIAILDFVFAMDKKLEANGLLHSVYLFFKNLVFSKPVV
jgi:hypothetical protein